MSIRSWKAEFYPEPANKHAGSPVEALRHSLQKWRGLLPSNLTKHGLRHAALPRAVIVDERDGYTFSFRSESCALCVHYEEHCSECPVKRLSDKACDAVGSAWREWVNLNDPLPMIHLLEQALAQAGVPDDPAQMLFDFSEVDQYGHNKPKEADHEVASLH